MNNVEKNLRFRGRFAMVILSLISYVVPSLAQNSVGVPPLFIEHPQPAFGFEFGVGQNTQQGSFTCPCGTMFSSGRGMGWSASAFYELPISNDLNVGLKTGYDRIHTISAIPTEHEVEVVESNSNQLDTMSVQVNRAGAITESILLFQPYIEYQILHTNFFIQIGAGISVLLSNNFTYTASLNSSYNFTNGSNVETVENGPYSLNTVQLSGILSAGYDFSFGNVSLAPQMTYVLPFTTVSNDNSNNWKISTISGAIAMKFNL